MDKRLENVDRTHLVLGSGTLLQKTLVCLRSSYQLILVVHITWPDCHYMSDFMPQFGATSPRIFMTYFCVFIHWVEHLRQFFSSFKYFFQKFIDTELFGRAGS